MRPNRFLALDIGAESGRALLGVLKKNRIQVQEIYRFENRMVSNGNHLFWDVNYLFQEIKTAMRKCTETYRGDVSSVGIDTWGVDFGLFDREGHLTSLPFAYRDKRNEKAMEKLKNVSVSIHCWQGDDVAGFEKPDSELQGGGIHVTGNYPGKARNPEQLRQDLEKVYSLLPGSQRLNLHAIYGEFQGQSIDRDQINPKHFEGWIGWA